LVFQLGVSAFEVIEDTQMFLGGQQVEKYIVLRADTHERANLRLLVEHISVVNVCFTVRGLDQTSKHGDRC
jgi:hypothetical protein